MAGISSKRIIAIDRLRGLCMIAVVIQFFLGVLGGTFESWAPLIEHGTDGFQILPGVAFADLFAPVFIFLVGTTLAMTYHSRESKYGSVKASFDMVIRFLSLMGMGVFLNSIEDGWIEVFVWGTPFAEISTNMKVFMITGLLAALLLILTAVKVKYASIALRYVLALMGAAVVFFIAVSAADRICPFMNDRFTLEVFGGYIWDTLENIGFAGLIALPLVKTDKWGKLAIVLSYYAFIGVYVQFGGIVFMESMLEGAPFAGFCWAGILLLGSFFMDIREDKKLYWSFAVGMTVVAIVLIQFCGIFAQKRGCTPAYALLTAGFAAILFGIFNLLENWKPAFKPFTWWGGSSILTYAVNYLLCLAVGAVFEMNEITLPIWQGLVLTVVYLALFTLLNYLLAKGNKHIKL